MRDVKTKQSIVCFVGSNPSRKNHDSLVPFQGTRSLHILFGWIKLMELDRYKLFNVTPKVIEYNKIRVSDYDLDTLDKEVKNEKLVVALGFVASKALTKLGVRHFRLPHPSGRNRQLNNPVFVKSQVLACKSYIVANREKE